MYVAAIDRSAAGIYEKCVCDKFCMVPSNLLHHSNTKVATVDYCKKMANMTN